MALDSFQIRLLEEGKAYRDEIGEPDAELDAMLARALGQRSIAPADEVADEPAATRRPGSGHSNYGGTSGPSEAQERFIRSLCAERGLDADAVLKGLTKSAASRKIDELKRMPRSAATVPAVARPATERQMEFLQDLLATREHDFADVEWNFAKASEAITRLLASPKLKVVADHGIRHGHYAWVDAEGVHHFYQVAQDGRIYVQAGPARHPYRGALNEALEAIKADPRSAAALYGSKIGRCGRCHLELTDETSRALGLGPICAGKSDW